MRDPAIHSSRAAYLAQIERYPELERGDELALAHRHRGGDARAGELLICAHLRDVVAIARGYLGYGQPLADLVAAGSLGLVRALDRFDPSRGLRFMTYAGYWVRAEILSHVVSTWSAVGFGKSSPQTRLFFGLRRERSRLEAQGYAGAALVDALAAHFDCTVARVQGMQLRLERRDVGFEFIEHQQDDGAEDLERQLAHAQWSGHLRERVEDALAQLDERERVIIERRLLDEDKPSRVELGRQLGISRERVRQLETRACRKLRRQLGAVARARI